MFSKYCALLARMIIEDKLIRDFGAETSVWNRYFYMLGSELSSQESDCSLSFQLA